jgi:hypothetical protein
LLKRRGHGLPAGLINVPRINALGVHFCNGPGQCMFPDACRKFRTALGSQFFRIVEPDNPPLWIENHRGGNHRTEQRAAAGFINAGDARPAHLARRSLETGRAESGHR